MVNGNPEAGNCHQSQVPHYQDLFKEILTECRKRSGAEEGGVLVRNIETGQLRVEYSEGEGVSEKNLILSEDSSKSFCATCAANRAPIYVADTRAAGIPFLPMSKNDIRSEFVLPFMHKDLCIGVVNLESYRSDAFPEEKRQAVKEYCNASTAWFALAIADRQNISLQRQAEAVGRVLELMCHHDLNQEPDLILQSILQHSLEP